MTSSLFIIICLLIVYSWCISFCISPSMAHCLSVRASVKRGVPSWLGATLLFTSTNFKKKKFRFPWCSTYENLSIDVSITNVGLILTKLWWFLFSGYRNSGYGQNSFSSISNFLKKFHIFGFPWCSTHENLSIDVSITN